LERVELNSNMKAIFATTFYHVLVGTNSGSLWGFGGELPIFIRHHVVTKWEFVHFHCLLPQVKDADLGIRRTLAKARFGVWFVLTILVTTSRVVTHGDTRIFGGVQRENSYSPF
jgi:hypothetical protein